MMQPITLYVQPLGGCGEQWMLQYLYSPPWWEYLISTTFTLKGDIFNCV